MPARPAPVLITTDLDRTLIFSPRAIAVLGGALPSDPVETSLGHTSGGQSSGGQTSGGQSSGGQTSGGQTSGGHTDGELCRAARDALAALPAHALICVATSRSIPGRAPWLRGDGRFGRFSRATVAAAVGR